MKRLPPRKSYEYRMSNPDTENLDLEVAYECPCCLYPTLPEVGGYFICPLCSWEDDDIDFGGPNGNYTLEQARQNFRAHWVMYDKDHKVSPQFQGKWWTDYVVELRSHPEVIVLKKAAVAILTIFMETTDPIQRGTLMSICQAIIKRL